MSRRNSRAIPRPVLKWAGGKLESTDSILEHIQKVRGVYREPFFGGGAVFFALVRAGRVKNAVISDSNRELIDTLIAIRDDSLSVVAAIAHLNPRDINEDRFLEIRSQDPFSLPLPQRAARMLYLNKSTYNGLYRVNKRAGAFNSPWGGVTKWVPDYKNLLAVADALQCAEIICADFGIVESVSAPGDVVYLDPPYLPRSNTSNFSAYTAGGFSFADHLRVASTFARLANNRVAVIASNADTPDARALYGIIPGAQLQELRVRRNINSVGTGRGRVGELLITHSKKRSQ